MSLEKVKEYFKKYDLEDRIYEFETSSATVELAANALGCLPDRTAKSLTFIVDNKPIMILACGTARIDNHKYKEKFNTVDAKERYKWIAVAWYKKYWNIEAEDFSRMISRAFEKAENLLTANMYYAYKVLTLFAEENPERVRELFRLLYNEEIALEKRYEDFRKGFDEYISLLKQKEEFKEKTLQHYQDLHTISVYLYFEYPQLKSNAFPLSHYPDLWNYFSEFYSL